MTIYPLLVYISLYIEHVQFSLYISYSVYPYMADIMHSNISRSMYAIISTCTHIYIPYTLHNQSPLCFCMHLLIHILCPSIIRQLLIHVTYFHLSCLHLLYIQTNHLHAVYVHILWSYKDKRNNPSNQIHIRSEEHTSELQSQL